MVYNVRWPLYITINCSSVNHNVWPCSYFSEKYPYTSYILVTLHRVAAFFVTNVPPGGTLDFRPNTQFSHFRPLTATAVAVRKRSKLAVPSHRRASNESPPPCTHFVGCQVHGGALWKLNFFSWSTWARRPHLADDPPAWSVREKTTGSTRLSPPVAPRYVLSA